MTNSTGPTLAPPRPLAPLQLLSVVIPARDEQDCVASTVGRETIEIVGKSHKVTHVSEQCSRPNSTVTNDFWIEGNVIRKSRQWASSRISYVEFEKIID